MQTANKPLGDIAILVRTVVGGVVAVLVMLGVGGTIFNLAARDGWIVQLFGRNLAGGLGAVLAFLIIGLCFWLTQEWITPRARNRFSEVFVYGFALAGGVYLAQFYLKGGWM
jgi:hypothetical protein